MTYRPGLKLKALRRRVRLGAVIVPSAPDNAEYLLLTGSAGLTAYRVVQLGNGLLAVDGGALGNWTLSADESQLDHNSLDQLTTGDPHTQYIQGAILSANGDILTRIGGVPDNLPVGTNGQVLTVVSNLPAWATPASTYRLLDSQPTEVVWNNTAAQQTLYTFTIPGSTLASGDLLRLRLFLDYLNNSAAGRTFTLSVSLGGTAMFTDTSNSIAASASRRSIFATFDFAVRNQNPNVRLSGFLDMSSAGAPAAGIGLLSSSIGILSPPMGDVNLTLSNNLTLLVQWTHSTNNANLEVRLRGATLEHITT